MRNHLLRWGLLFLLVCLPISVHAQGPEPERLFWEMTNEARAANGVGRLAWNEQLAEAAHLHAQDIAGREDPGHIGSDGSTPQQRAERAGYPPYPDGVRASENWSTGSAMEAMAYFVEDQIHRDNMLLPIWREVGVGRAETSWGGELWVVLYGAQPGVLPIFINQDEPRTTQRRVTVQLRSEEAGFHPDIFTTPMEMRLGEPESIEVARWRPWQPESEITLSPGGGEKTVIVELRDGQGHVVSASDTITLVVPNGPVPTPRTQLAPTLTATLAPTETTVPTGTPAPGATVTVVPTPTPEPTPAPLISLPEGIDQTRFFLGLGLLGWVVAFVLGIIFGRGLRR